MLVIDVETTTQECRWSLTGQKSRRARILKPDGYSIPTPSGESTATAGDLITITIPYSIDFVIHFSQVLWVIAPLSRTTVGKTPNRLTGLILRLQGSTNVQAMFAKSRDSGTKSRIRL
jgi:hypothetical protein